MWINSPSLTLKNTCVLSPLFTVHVVGRNDYPLSEIHTTISHKTILCTTQGSTLNNPSTHQHFSFQWSHYTPRLSHLHIKHGKDWLASQQDAQITCAIIVTDSMNLLQKVESGRDCPDWHTAIHSLRLPRLLWAMLESKGKNGQIDWPAQQTSHLAEMLRG